MVLSEQELLDTLWSKCCNAKNRIWIASPFIGNLKGVQEIIGGNWMSVDFRILTDVDSGFILKDTYNEFTIQGAKIRTLHSLHAKIYIIDDWCLVTSANLTNTAFTRRYEMGISADDIDSINDVVKTFDRWWNMASAVNHLPSATRPLIDMKQYQNGTGFAKKFKSHPYSKQMSNIDKYGAKCKKYIEFANLYEKVTGRNQEMVAGGYTLLQEVDYFFNFLYHEHQQKPSYKLDKTRKITDAERDKAVMKHFKEMSIFYVDNPQLWRLNRSKTIQNLLNPQRIKSLSWDDVKEVVEAFHCLHSYSIIKTKFLNPNNNNIGDIKKNWNELLNNGNITTIKISEVIRNLKFFGPSCTQELIGWYYTDKYPIINTNSDCGMRYFGYEV